jgi:hypothetical protein
MSAFKSDSPRNRLPAIVLAFLILIVAALAGGAFYYRARLESEPPQVKRSSDTDVPGLVPLEINVVDSGIGLKSVTVTLLQGGAEQTLASEQYRQPVREKKNRRVGVEVSRHQGRPCRASHRRA